jgi:hypothetical protein
MSSSWCMWCTAHPSTWNQHPVPSAEDWTMEKIITMKERIDRKEIKLPREMLGVVNYPVWDFVEPQNYIFPELHVEIGLVNNVLDKFYSFIDDKVEAVTQEELTRRNSFIVADVALTRALNRLSNWKEDTAPQLEFHRHERMQVANKLKTRNLESLEIADLRSQMQQLDTEIAEMVQQRKALEADLTLKRKFVGTAKAALKKVRETKKKIEMPAFADIENILLEFGISAAAYHGGNLNGVDCRELMKLAKPIFERFKTSLLSVSHPNRCSEGDIRNACDLHRDICVTLDALTSKVRMKKGEPLEEDYELAEKHLNNLYYLWTQAKLSFTPKIHGLLSHAVPQMRRLNGIGDTLEDDVERIHQISAQIESRVSRMKNKGQQAHVHSKMEAIQNSTLVKAKIEASQLQSKRVFKKRNIEKCAHERSKRLKEDRDISRSQTMLSLEGKPHAPLITSHEASKAEMLGNTSNK